MSDKDKLAWPEPSVRNPQYDGATPKMVAMALLCVKPDEKQDGRKEQTDQFWQSNI